MKLSDLLGVLPILSAPAVHAAISDDMLIYADRFHNGWGDSWSWMPRHAANNPVRSGSNSMALVPSGQWQAWWLKSSTGIDTSAAGRHVRLAVQRQPAKLDELVHHDAFGIHDELYQCYLRCAAVLAYFVEAVNRMSTRKRRHFFSSFWRTSSAFGALSVLDR